MDAASCVTPRLIKELRVADNEGVKGAWAEARQGVRRAHSQGLGRPS